jgi:hypothetical protein
MKYQQVSTGDQLRRLCGLYIIYTLVLGVSLAQAIPLLDTLNIDESSRPFGGRSASTSPYTSYYNPARLTRSTQSFTFTYLAINQNMKIKLGQRPQGYDIPEDVYRARVIVDGQTRGLPFSPLPSSQLPEKRRGTSIDQVDQFAMFGLMSKFLDDRLVFGMTAVLPVDVFQEQQPFYVDERAQFFSNRMNFELYGDRFRVTTFAVALAYQVHERLSLGVGASLANELESVPQIYLRDAGNQEDSETNPQTKVKAVMSPYVGLAYHYGGFELSSSVHFPSKSSLEGRGELRFWDFDYPEGQTFLKQDFSLTFLDQPLRVNVAPKVTLDLSGMSLDMYGDVAWARWSTYTSRQNHNPKDWVDTWSARVGSSLNVGRHRVGVGVMYEPTPIPTQTGRTNYVDNARAGGQVGWSWRPSTSTPEFEIGVGIQVQRLLERMHVKSSYDSADLSGDGLLDELPDDAVDVTTNQPLPSARGLQTNNLGFPSYQHGGWLSTLFFTIGFAPASNDNL